MPTTGNVRGQRAAVNEVLSSQVMQTAVHIELKLNPSSLGRQAGEDRHYSRLLIKKLYPFYQELYKPTL